MSDSIRLPPPVVVSPRIFVDATDTPRVNEADASNLNAAAPLLAGPTLHPEKKGAAAVSRPYDEHHPLVESVPTDTLAAGLHVLAYTCADERA